MKYLVLLTTVACCFFLAQGKSGPKPSSSKPRVLRVGAESIAKVLVTPCGNLTNSRYKFGVLRYNRSSNVASIICVRGYTFKGAPTRTCNATLGQWDNQKKLYCTAGHVGICPRPPPDSVGTCVMSCANDTQCDSNKKCCSNGCGYKCMSSVNDGLCGINNNQARYKKVLDEAAACTSDDRRNWCSGYYENVTKDCMSIMVRRLPDFIHKMKPDELNNMLEIPRTLEALCKRIDTMSNGTLNTMLRIMSDQNRLAFLQCLVGNFLRKLTNYAVGRLMVGALKKQYGKQLENWKPEDLKGKSMLLCFLKRGDAGKLMKNKAIDDIIKGISPEDAAVIMKERACGALRKEILKKYGKTCSKWTSNTLKTLNNMLIDAFKASPKCISDIPKKEFCGAFDVLAELRDLEPHILRKILARVDEEKCAGKSLKDRTAQELLSLKHLLCGLRSTDIKTKIPKDKMSFDLADKICRCPDPKLKSKGKKKSKFQKKQAEVLENSGRRRSVLAKLQEKTALSKWTDSDFPKVLFCLDDVKVCKNIPKAAFAALTQKNILPKDFLRALMRMRGQVRKCLRKRAQEAHTEESAWKSGLLATLKDFTITAKDIKNLSPEELSRAAKMISGDDEEFRKTKIFFVLNKQGKADFSDFLDRGIPCELLRKFPEKVITDMGLKDTAANADEKLEQRQQKDIPLSTSACILDIYIKKVGSPPKEVEDLNALGTEISKALSAKNIGELTSKDAIYQFLQSLGLKIFQLKKAIKRLKELGGEIEAEDVCKLKQAVGEVSLEKLKKLPLESEEGCSLLGILGDVDPVELGKAKVQEIAGIIVSKLGDKIIKDDVDSVGPIILGFTKAAFDKLEDDALPSALKTIAEYSDDRFVPDDTVKSLADRLRKIKADKFDDADVCDYVMPLNKFFREVIDSLDSKTFEKARSCIVNSPTKDTKTKDIVKKKLKASKTKRRRRAIDSSMTIEKILEDGLYISSEKIRTVPFSVYEDNAEQIGNLEYSEEQLQAWAHVAKNGNEASKMTPDLIKSLGRVCTGLSASDIGSLNFEDDETIEKCAKQPGFSSEQRLKGLAQVKSKKGKSIAQFDEGELIALSNFALALTPDEIGSIPKDVYRGVLGDFGKLSGWSEDQLNKLKDKAVDIYGPVSSWKSNTFVEIKEVNAAIGGFSKSEIEGLTKEQIENFPENAVSQIPVSKLKYYSVEQLNALSPKQTSVFTNEQKNALPDDIKKNVCKDSACPEEDHSGSTQVAMGALTIVMAILVAMIPLY